VDARAFSMTQKRTLSDNQGIPIVDLKKDLFSRSWRASDPNSSRRLFDLRPELFSFSPSIKVFLNDGDREADFKIKGTFFGHHRNFSIYDRRFGRKQVIAFCTRESPWGSVQAFVGSYFGADSYQVRLQPGADAAFIVSLCLIIDELYNEHGSHK